VLSQNFFQKKIKGAYLFKRQIKNPRRAREPKATANLFFDFLIGFAKLYSIDVCFELLDAFRIK
jgi:hypothetical protein